MSYLIGRDNNAKTIKGNELKFATGVLNLAPFNLSGVMNVCSQATPGCAAACLNTAGHGGMFDASGTNKVQEARIKRTEWLFNDRKSFLKQLDKEIQLFIKWSEKKGFTPVIRLNCTSDLAWESATFSGGIWEDGFKGSIIERYPNVQFYDYTKILPRMMKYLRGKMPSNYHLTFSWAETQKKQNEAMFVLGAGGNVAVVFSNENFPKRYKGFKVINGDKHDLRFLDKKNVIVGLKAKGKGKKDKSGFVVPLS